MASQDDIKAAEAQIDRAFAQSALLEHASCKQAIWSLLSCAEDYYFAAMHVHGLDEHMPVAIDNLLNELAYPLRECWRQRPQLDGSLERRYIAADHQAAAQWLDAADNYAHFCSIFPLWRRGKITLSVQDDTLQTSDWSDKRLEYEAYNRLTPKDGIEEEEEVLDDAVNAMSAVDKLIRARLTSDASGFNLRFDRALIAAMHKVLAAVTAPRHTLPDHWQLDGFTFGDFRRTFAAVHAMALAWHKARALAGQGRQRGHGYERSVLLISRHELRRSIVRYTGVDGSAVEAVLALLTFGSADVRDPDIATQPLVVFDDGLCAISPFVWINSHAERNLCAVLNLVPRQQALYSRLTQEKEALLREEIGGLLAAARPQLDVRHGAIVGTDVDLAVLDRAQRVCLCLELKWFIEPAEIREIVERSQELAKGVSQAKRIGAAFERADAALLRLLDIDSSWTFQAIVAPRNWIGHFDVQDPAIPIVKALHVATEICKQPSLAHVLTWLRERRYLPVLGEDFTVPTVAIKCGPWRSTWYGIGIGPAGAAQDQAPAATPS